jgi:hypothetical protein
VNFGLAGDNPQLMLTAPIPATQKALAKAGLTMGDMDITEINEAFASVVLAWEKELHPDMSKVNPNGGAIALGHPLGASGTRLMTTLLHELERTGGRYGLQTMCEGGGIVLMRYIWKFGFGMLRSMTSSIPPPPPSGEMRKINVRYRCSVCGVELRVVMAPDEEPPPPKHCLEEMDVIAPVFE